MKKRYRALHCSPDPEVSPFVSFPFLLSLPLPHSQISVYYFLFLAYVLLTNPNIRCSTRYYNIIPYISLSLSYIPIPSISLSPYSTFPSKNKPVYLERFIPNLKLYQVYQTHDPTASSRASIHPSHSAASTKYPS